MSIRNQAQVNALAAAVLAHRNAHARATQFETFGLVTGILAAGVILVTGILAAGVILRLALLSIIH